MVTKLSTYRYPVRNWLGVVLTTLVFLASCSDTYREVSQKRFMQILRKAGVTIRTGTDAGFLNSYVYPDLGLHHELGYFVKAGLTPLQALQSAIISGPTFPGKADLYGDIAPGKSADIVLLDRNPIQNISATQAINTVILRGIVYDRKALDARLADVKKEGQSSMNTDLVQPIGVFDSGYGGLTILREIVNKLPRYDYVYLGDNARTPYGTRSFETVYHYTLECVQQLFDAGCRLVILACNTASAKALRNIQQLDLPALAPDRRVLGVIRPTTEVIGNYSKTGHVGILATRGTVTSESYVVEIEKAFPKLQVYQEACPMWVPLVENGEYDHPGTDYFVKQHIDRLMAKSPEIDTLLLACTHYPLLLAKIQQAAPARMTILSQGRIVADSLADYLMRHPEMEAQCSKTGQRVFLTTDSTDDFDRQATIFYGQPVQSAHLAL